MAAALLIASLALLGAVSAARSQPQARREVLSVGATGWGSVKAIKGVVMHPLMPCTSDAPGCSGEDIIDNKHVVLVEKPYKGWKFAGWHGGCRSKKKSKCVIDAAHAHKNAYGQRIVHASARFIPVAAGLTRAHPLPIGTAATTHAYFVVKVNSTNANVPLTPPAPTGAEYFDANVTVTYTGGGSEPPDFYGFSVEGSHDTTYSDISSSNCPDPGPQPGFDFSDPLYSGQSTTGYICWTIAANDAGTFELYFGDGSLNWPGTTWFALH